MSDVFVSYAHEDRARAAAFAQALENLGWSVWWDDHTRPGAEFDSVVDQQLDSARCVVVVWSSASVPSRWVKAEAAAADEQGKLLPITFERDLRLPVLFRQLATTFLTSSDVTERTPGAMTVLAEISRMTGKTPAGLELTELDRSRSSGARVITAGTWRITARFLGMKARYDLTLHPTGSVTGKARFGPTRATLAGRWQFDPSEQTLHLELSGGLQEGMKASPVTITQWTSADAADCRFEGRRAHIERIARSG